MLHFAPVHTFGPHDGVTQGMSAVIVVANHAACHTQLLRLNDLIIICDDTGAGRHIDAVGFLPNLIKDQGIEHMDTLGQNNAVLMALHFMIAASPSGFEIIPRNLHLFPVSQAVERGNQQIDVHAVRGFPVGSFRRPLIQRKKEIIHAQYIDLHAQIFQIFLQTHGSCGFSAARRTGQCHKRFTVGKNGTYRCTDLVVIDFLAAQHKLGFVPHIVIDVFQIDHAHDNNPFLYHCIADIIAFLHSAGNGRTVKLL